MEGFQSTNSLSNSLIKSNSCGVLIYFIGSKIFFIRNKLSDNDGRILILHVDIMTKNFILINLFILIPKLKTVKNSFETEGDANEAISYSE